MILDHVDKIAHSTEQSLFTDYVNMSILLGEPLVPLLAYPMVRAVVEATEIIRYVESGLTVYLNDAQTFGLMRRIGTELCFT